ncbi:GNAT family N-acetyltransferase [Microlunatus speluncae]|uniref:bifunctional acetate--CoA ligase family protein/GNAT family N-acetyltransferase n=1 Tax=Microlunatus speluncae TaxID=2594267 RepID=UPI001375D54C|nr:GNAT family N-acetyltransferase [Microlunatus speluncae]
MSAAQQSGNPPGYPSQWEADVLLTDGRVARLRPIKPSDATRLVEFYDRVSPESKYLRFFAPYPRLSQKDVSRFTEVDYVDRVAFILTLGELMIGVGRYDRLENDQAEVAFLIEDAHQGRGIAQLLLEHLAEAARERGITKFVAEILPENRRMAQVFVDAGYRVSKDVEDGVLSVEFPILPTDTSVGVMERREHRAEAASMLRLLTPERVVVLGPGRRVQGLVNSLLSGGFRGEVTAVSTDSDAVSGVRTAASIATIEGSFDLVVVSIPTNELGAVVIDAAHKGAHAMVVLTGTDSAHDNRTVVSLARAYGVRAIGPDALGLINTDPSIGLNASPGPMPRTGGVGIFCQSAAVGVALINRALRQNIGLSSFISSGAYADVTGNDVMQFWQDDEATRACLLMLDSLGNPRKFFRIIRQLTRRKPVIVFAPGQARRSSHIGVRGGLGHAPEQAVDALFRQAGVIVVHRRGAMFDIAKIASRQPLPAGPRVRVIANSATLVQQLIHTVTAVGLLAGGDPVVLPGDAPHEQYAEAVRAALADDGCDAIVCAAVAIFDSGTDALHATLDDLARQAKKPLVGVLIDFDEYADAGGDDDGPGGLPTFDSPADAIQALSALSAYAHWRERDPGAVPLLDVDELAAKRVVNRVLSRDRAGRELTGPEAMTLLSVYGIELVPRHRVSDLNEAIEVADRLGWDVVLKARSRAVRGRPDLAGVYRNLETAAALREAWTDLGELTAELGLGDDPAVADPVIQPMAPPGVPLIMTSREDAAFGPMLSLGLDGIASELLGDTVHRVPPLTTADAAAMVRDLRAAPTLFGRNGSPGVDVAAVQDLLHRLAQLADDLPQLASVTLSPVIASLSGVRVLGARVLIAPTGDQRDPMARTL